MQKRFDTTKLDFKENKDSLIEFLKNYDNKFSDYNFDGSNISHLLDVFAADNVFKSMMAHLAVNETNISTAQIRGNVVSRAKDLGYTPHSVIASRAIIKITINNPIGNPVPNILELPRGTNFSASGNGFSFNFITQDSYFANYDSFNDRFVFEDVIIYEGTLKNLLKRVDGKIQNQKFEIRDEFADISTLRCKVREHEISEYFEIYSNWENEINLDSDSKVFFTQENRNGFFEVYFGNNVMGKKLENNNIIEFEYIRTNAEDANGISVFSINESIEGNNDITIETLSNSSGGSDRESIEEIRHRGPLWRTTQNRAVTNQDYKSLIERFYPNIQSISVWGGQDNINSGLPDYGKVFIAIKPKADGNLSPSEKKYLVNYLKTKNVSTITPEILDPDYSDLSLEVFYKYNPKITNSTLNEISSKILQTIRNYNDNQLNKFDGVFRYSNFLNLIDKSDVGVINSTARIYLQKTIIPSYNSPNYIELNFFSPFYITDRKDPIISTNSFLINGERYYFEDVPTSNEKQRKLVTYIIEGSQKRIINNDAGIVYADTGQIIINNFIPDDSSPITFTVIPNSDDIAPRAANILRINIGELKIFGEVDSIITRGNSGFNDYSTTPRLK